MRRGPEAHIHGDQVILPARAAAIIAPLIPADLRSKLRLSDPATYDALLAVRLIALQRGTIGSSPQGTIRAPQGELPRGLTTKQAADRLGIGVRGVRRAIESGRLPATQVDGRWRIEADAVSNYTTRGN